MVGGGERQEWEVEGSSSTQSRSRTFRERHMFVANHLDHQTTCHHLLLEAQEPITWVDHMTPMHSHPMADQLSNQNHLSSKHILQQ